MLQNRWVRRAGFDVCHLGVLRVTILPTAFPIPTRSLEPRPLYSHIRATGTDRAIPISYRTIEIACTALRVKDQPVDLELMRLPSGRDLNSSAAPQGQQIITSCHLAAKR